jgi:hypothetical protein
MKIKISESQAKRLQLIKEETNPLIGFEQFCKVKIQEINKLYTNISHVSIGEIVNHEIDMTKINNRLEEIETSLNEMNKKAYDYINNLPESDLDLRIDRASDSVSNKLTSLQLIIGDLEKIQKLVLDHNLGNSFSDIKPIDISNNQNNH